jgi:hypothetical protein
MDGQEEQFEALVPFRVDAIGDYYGRLPASDNRGHAASNL